MNFTVLHLDYFRSVHFGEFVLGELEGNKLWNGKLLVWRIGGSPTEPGSLNVYANKCTSCLLEFISGNEIMILKEFKEGKGVHCF
jgi:hypothetical protein